MKNSPDTIPKVVSVRGLQGGAPTSALEGMSFDSVEPSFGGRIRRDPGQRYWTAEGGTTEVELSTPDILEMLIRQGMRGNLRTEECMFKVAEGQVKKIFLFAPLLEPLGLDTESSVEEAFGPAEGTERSYGTMTLHYPARDIQVHFRPKHSVTVVLGDDPANGFQRAKSPPSLPGLDGCFAEDDAGAEFHGSKATAVRYERLCALLRVFGFADHQAWHMARG